MGLPDGAFDQNRNDALKAQTSIDVAACPGSGKTTLLVAKLAIMARKWTDTRRGICVLSHTNVARNEIEQRLGSTAEGQALLGYPHFIGTIHGFVDRFLGMPWIKACGFPVSIIDTEAALARRWKRLPVPTRTALENKRNGPGILQIDATDFSVGDVSWGRGGTLGRHTVTYRNMVAACRETAEAGYFCYEDPFLWGRELTETAPETIETLRTRFPILFIDEAQDNSELQSSILHRVFVDGEADVIWQRFGDANQAIFHSVNSKEATTTWVFPNDDIKRDIPDSHRFGQAIADFAAPLAVVPQDLIGSGPDQRKAGVGVDGQNAVFLFAGDARSHILPAFTEHLREVFSPEALEKGSFVAVGGKHKEPDNGDNKPNSVCDYWQDYAPEQTKADPRPDTFVGYVQLGRAKMDKGGNGNLHPKIESIASGVLEAVRRAGGKVVRWHRKDHYIREVLFENVSVLASYNEFMRRFAVDGEELTQQVWDDEWRQKIGEVIEAVFEGEAEYQVPQAFFNWPDADAGTPADAKAGTVYQKDEQLPKIRLGSIHSVKGETHTGVLVLETYIRSYLMKAIKRWLLGNAGTERLRDSQSSKLKLHYVAMTRPTHLLCLALPSGTFTDQEISTLSGRGWRIARVAADGQVIWQAPPEGC
ncbi:MAG: ATP-dependent helicase [Alphaproteobacteria bacterium]|nr:ATP-dependent helicase [Alphaproteobacteria bacterium]